jgi:hypothetical protein
MRFSRLRQRGRDPRPGRNPARIATPLKFAHSAGYDPQRALAVPSATRPCINRSRIFITYMHATDPLTPPGGTDFLQAVTPPAPLYGTTGGPRPPEQHSCALFCGLRRGAMDDLLTSRSAIFPDHLSPAQPWNTRGIRRRPVTAAPSDDTDPGRRYFVRCAVAIAVSNSAIIAAEMSSLVDTWKKSPGDAQFFRFVPMLGWNGFMYVLYQELVGNGR